VKYYIVYFVTTSGHIDVLADQLVGIATSSALQQSLKQNVQYEYDKISWHDVARTCMRIYRTVKQGASS